MHFDDDFIGAGLLLSARLGEDFDELFQDGDFSDEDRFFSHRFSFASVRFFQGSAVVGW